MNKKIICNNCSNLVINKTKTKYYCLVNKDRKDFKTAEKYFKKRINGEKILCVDFSPKNSLHIKQTEIKKLFLKIKENEDINDCLTLNYFKHDLKKFNENDYLIYNQLHNDFNLFSNSFFIFTKYFLAFIEECIDVDDYVNKSFGNWCKIYKFRLLTDNFDEYKNISVLNDEIKAFNFLNLMVK